MTKKICLTTSLPVALWRLLAGTVMVKCHGIGSCHGTAERIQEKVMVLLSASERSHTHIEDLPSEHERLRYAIRSKLQVSFVTFPTVFGN